MREGGFAFGLPFQTFAFLALEPDTVGLRRGKASWERRHSRADLPQPERVGLGGRVGGDAEFLQQTTAPNGVFSVNSSVLTLSSVSYPWWGLPAGPLCFNI